MSTRKIFHFLQQTGSLLLMPRTHVRTLGTAFDTVASHSFHVSIVAYCLARMESLSHTLALKSMAMGLLHDVSEARTGDMDFPARIYTVVDEKRAVKDQFAGYDFGPDLALLVKEYEDRKTKASHCAKDADSLQQLYLEWVLSWQGNKLAGNWFSNDFKARVPNLFTASAKNLAGMMRHSNPQAWWTEFIDATQLIRDSYGRNKKS